MADTDAYSQPPPDRTRHGQHVSDSVLGDCHRACMSVLLDVPNGPHLPTPDATQATNGRWWFMWREFLDGFGLEARTGQARDAIWGELWIASVPSLNFPGCGHSIVMRDSEVWFDPSPALRYEGDLLGEDVVVAGTHLAITNPSRLPRLVEFQTALNGPSEPPGEATS